MESHKKKILVVTDQVPRDSSQAGAPRIFELCKALKDKYEFHLFLITSDDPEIEILNLERVFSQVHIRYFDSSITETSKRLFRLLSPTASFDYRITHKKELQNIRSEIREHYTTEGFGGILIDQLRASQFIDDTLKQHAVLDFCDCLTKLNFRYVKGMGSVRCRLSTIMAVIGLFFWERSEARKVYASCLVSGDDLGIFKWGLAEKSIPHIVPLGIATDYFFSKSPLPSKHSLMFFGTLNYTPNTDACIWLAQEIFPLIKKSFPESTLEIIGANAPQKVLSLSAIQGVSIFTDVPDIRPYIERNAICLTPLRLGAGVKNKILVAMSLERPVISTQIALEGLHNKISNQALVGNTPEELAKRVTDLFSIISSESSRDKFSEKLKNIRNNVISIYSWEICAEPLDKLLDKASTS